MVFELKAGRFKPKYAGKMNFYLSAVDSQLKHETDNPSIGVILCRLGDSVEIEYALRDMNKPIGISLYELQKNIPKDIIDALPTVDEIEKELHSLEE